ncbi:alpha/beta-hydrolase [Teratosphaeria nubilosa]|uniref:Alpha/beta-hydrolase n=1 Tax=Teratosphaeria nubilosa TaxID=161662 RepID=A0A6G1LDD3_9PEZI|nr:alpha/beta-hydrolase [Teratosphaeria nubilosa]
MARVPVLSRLNVVEYLALTLSFTLVLLETIARSITLLLPAPVIRLFYRLSRNAFNSLSSPVSRRARNRKKSVSSPIAQAHDFVEICDLFGYYAEEHVVQTGDGYLLGLHRLGWKRGEEDHRVNNGPDSIRKKVVYLHHGLLMNSEVWVCITEQERCIPFMLVEQGYDVWLGNNRGNKYSKKSVHSKPTELRFWDFSMDQFAFHDIPDSINYILETTGQPSLSYIGFSQGTAQAFATLSIHPTLNNKVDVFVALAPAMAPPGLASGVVASLCKSNPEVLFLAFGRKAILASSTMWCALLYPAIFTWVIDTGINFLFGWKTQNITPHQKLAAYPHLYSFTSTKCVVHWFQIIRNGTFQMYDDEVTTPLAVGNGAKYYKVAKFPTRNIKTPIVLVYGGSDSLVDIKLMLKELPRHTVAKAIPKYEHLDLLWASDVDKLVFPHVLEALDTYADSEHTKTAALGWASALSRAPGALLDRASPAGSLPPGYSEDERDRVISRPASRLRTSRMDGVDDLEFGDFGQPSVTGEQLDETDEEDTADERVGSGVLGVMAQEFGTSRPRSTEEETHQEDQIQRRRKRVSLLGENPEEAETLKARSEDGRRNPEGWWSSATSGSEEESRETDGEGESAVPVPVPPVGPPARLVREGSGGGRKRVGVDGHALEDGR